MMTKKPTSTPSDPHSAKNSKKNDPSASEAKKSKPSSPYEAREIKGPKTRIVIKYDVGFPNAIYLRGKGANLSWDKGICLKNIKHDEWMWETDTPFTSCEFKVLINDTHYEAGENHRLTCGAHIHYSPKF